MSEKLGKTESLFAARRKRVLHAIRGEAALFPGAPELTVSRDRHYPFHQNRDLWYLTGFDEPNSALLLLGASKGPRSVLYLQDRDREVERWVGERLGIARAKRKFQIDEIRPYSSLNADLPHLLNGINVLHYALGVNERTDRMVWRLLQTPVGPRINLPHTLKDSRLITSSLRAVKDAHEIRTLRRACNITAQGIRQLIKDINIVKSERHGATLLESYFARLGAERTSFATIIAAGKNATVLHHEPKFHPLWKRELVLIDAGAEFNGYAGDITRTVPVSGVFSQPQARVYDIVYEALQAAILKSEPGSSLENVHRAAVYVITRGLVNLGILQGNVRQLVSSGAYKKYYMHRTGHWLGLDVHDITPIYFEDRLMPPANRPLVPGNVFTVEPGLYFDPKDTDLPLEYRGIGIRLEEDVLITPSGREVLTSALPCERSEIEALMKRPG